ncbi:MAG: nodulation protein NfeD [Proteobacteria bacterium]|nr:nodulation protein NfeD [Pseudomonadota bacterium]
MRIFGRTALPLIVLTLALFSGALAETKGEIFRAVLDDEIINPPTAEYITAAIDEAEARGAACLIIEIDTPGGLLASTRTIVKRIMNSSVPIVAYVSPRGARAGSAGVFITLSADVAAMAPSTNIGAAHPVQIGEKPKPREGLSRLIDRLIGPDEKGDEPKAEPMEDKILQDTTAWAEALARERGRNAQWAVKAVTESASITAEKALSLGVIDLVAENSEELLRKIDGRTVEIAGESLRLATAGRQIVDIPKDLRQRLLAALAHPNVAYVLLMLGFYGLLFEFTTPGVGFPGIAGAICLVLSFFGLQVLPTSYAGLALIAIGVAMFIAEVKVTSYGMLTLGGLVSLLAGSLMLFKSPHDFMRVSVPLAAAFGLSTLAVVAFLGWLVARSRRPRASTGTEGMAGATGQVRSWSGGRGKVFVHGEIWEATGPIRLAPGDSVLVVRADGMALEVKASEKPTTKEER